MAELSGVHDSSLHLLAGRLAGLTVRRPGLALGLWGEAGIGKTYRSQALLRAVPCRSVSVHAAGSLAAMALALPRPRKLAVWLERALERLKAGQDSAPTEWPLLLSALLSASAPITLHVEDLHEAPPERAEVWSQLARAVIRTRGVGLLVTSRSPPPDPFEAVRLAPLDRSASDALLVAEAGATLPPEALAWLYEHAAGNPLFTLEFFRLLARQGSLWNDGQRWRWRAPRREVMPVTVEAVIEQALANVLASPELQAVLEARALLGSEEAESVWAEVAGRSVAELDRARSELERRGVLSGPHFVHPLYREVALHQLPKDRREGLARRALEALQSDPGRAAGFVSDAGLEPAVALDWLERAAAEAENEVQAARFQARAVEYVPLERRATLLLRAAKGLAESDLPAALRLAERAHDTAPDSLEATGLLAELLARQGRLVEALRCLNGLSETAQGGVSGLARRVHVHAVAKDHPGVLALWFASPELQAMAGADVSVDVALALAAHGQFDEAAALTTHTLAFPGLDARTSSSLINVLGQICYGRDDFRRAAEHYARALETAREARLPLLEAAYLMNHALAMGALCLNRERLADLEASLRLHVSGGQVLRTIHVRVSLADAHLDLGHYAQAEELLLDCRDQLSRLGFPDEHLIECEYRLSTLYRDWAPPHGAVLAIKHAHAALAYARQANNARKIAWCLGYASIAEARFGNAARARALAQEALALCTALKSPGQLGLARFALAHVLEAEGHGEAAARAFDAVEAELHAQDNGDAAHEVGLEADRLTGRADRAAARLAWFEQRDMINLANLARRYFPELAGLTQPPTKPAPSARLQLLGDLCFSDGGPSRSVRGRKRQELLALLASARLSGRAEVSRLGLLDALYPDMPEPQANAALGDVVYQVRAQCGAGVVRTTTLGYALGDVALDAEEFLKEGDTRLWRGPYLAGLNVNEDGVQGALYLALRERAEALLNRDPTEAARVGRVLLEADPYDLASLRLTLHALRAAQNHKSLKRTYEQARVRFLDVGEHLPGNWAEFLEQGRPIGTTA